MGDNNSNLVSEEAFWEWLNSRATPSQLSEMYRYASELRKCFAQNHSTSASVLEAMSLTSASHIRQTIARDKNFQKQYSNYDRQFISSLLDYMEFFLKENKPSVSGNTTIKTETVSMKKPEQAQVFEHKQGTPSIQPDDIRNVFLSYLDHNVAWQKDDLMASLSKMEKAAGKDRLFSSDMDEALRTVKLLRYQQKYKDSSRTDKKLMDLLEKFFSQQKGNPTFVAKVPNNESETKQLDENNSIVQTTIETVSPEKPSPEKSEEELWNWLENKVTPAYITELYTISLELQTILSSIYHYKTSVFNEIKVSSYDIVRKEIFSAPNFKNFFNDYKRKRISEYLDYIKEFLSSSENNSSATISAPEKYESQLQIKEIATKPDEAQRILDIKNPGNLSDTSPVSIKFFEDENNSVKTWLDVYVHFLTVFNSNFPGYLHSGMVLSEKSQFIDIFDEDRAVTITKRRRISNTRLFVRTNDSADSYLSKIKFLLNKKKISYDNLKIAYYYNRFEPYTSSAEKVVDIDIVNDAAFAEFHAFLINRSFSENKTSGIIKIISVLQKTAIQQKWITATLFEVDPTTALSNLSIIEIKNSEKNAQDFEVREAVNALRVFLRQKENDNQQNADMDSTSDSTSVEALAFDEDVTVVSGDTFTTSVSQEVKIPDNNNLSSDKAESTLTSTDSLSASIEKESNEIKTINFNDLEDFSFSQPVSFTTFGNEQEVTKWREIYRIVCSRLQKRFPEEFSKLRSESLQGIGGLRLSDYEHYSSLKAALYLGNGYYIEGNRSANDLMRNLKTIMDRCGVSYNDLIIKYQPTKLMKYKDENDDIRLVLKKLSAETSERISAAMIAKEINNRLTPYQVSQILDQVPWSKKHGHNSYRYVELETEIVPVASEANDAGPILETEHQEIVESIKSILKDLSKKKTYGVSVVYIASRINLDKKLVMQILEEAEWAKETNEGFVYVEKQPEHEFSDTEINDVPGLEISDPEVVSLKWEDYECAILLEACLEMRRKHRNRGTVINQVSNRLRTIAKMKGLLIDRSFRDENSIRNQMLRMESAINGKTLMQAPTKQFQRIVEIYKTDRDRFNAILREAESPNRSDDPETDGKPIVQPDETEQTPDSDKNKTAEGDLETPSSQLDSHSPSAQPRWTLQEAAVLLDAYLKVQEHPEQRKALVQQVSDQLRQMAVNQGMQISDTFRNYAGINMQMYSMETAWTGRETFGHAHSNKVFTEIVRLYRDDPNAFSHLLNEAYPLLTKVKESFIINKELFRKFLDKQGISTYNQVYYCACLENMAGDFREKLFGKDIEHCLSIVIKIKTKIVVYGTTSSKKEALSYFEQFLSELKSVYNKEWILAQLEIKQIKYKDNRSKNGCLWIVGGHELDDFIQECTDHGYSMWFKENGCKAFPFDAVWWTNNIQSSYYEQDPGASLPDIKQRYRSILAEKFHSGYILGAIARKRFRKFYQEKYQEHAPDDNDSLDKVIRELCIEADGRYYIPDAMMNDEQKKRVMEYLQKRAEAGEKAVSYQVVFDDLSGLLVDTEISTSEMLRLWLPHACKGRYRIDKDYIIFQGNTSFDPEREIRDYLHEARVPVDYDQICRDLSHIPADKIKTILSYNSPTILNNASNQWFEVGILDLTAEDFRKIRFLIDKNLNEQEYVLVRSLYTDLCNIYPDVSDQLAILSLHGLQNYLKYKLNNIYKFKGQVISSHVHPTNIINIYRNFAKRNVPFTIDDLKQLSKDLNTNIYFDSTFSGCIRINARDFVSKESVHFDIEKTDEILGQFISGSYIPLKAFHSFDLLPPCGTPWNIFLLEQYVYQYSRRFHLSHAGFSMDMCAGAIVRRSSQINDFKLDLLPLVLSEGNVPLSKKEATNYLADVGFTTRGHMDITDEMLQKAKMLRAQKGKK